MHNPLLDSGGDIGADAYGFQPGAVRFAVDGVVTLVGLLVSRDPKRLPLAAPLGLFFAVFVVMPLVLLAWREKDGLGELGGGLAVTVLTWMGLLVCGSLADPESILMLVPLEIGRAHV